MASNNSCPYAGHKCTSDTCQIVQKIWSIHYTSPKLDDRYVASCILDVCNDFEDLVEDIEEFTSVVKGRDASSEAVVEQLDDALTELTIIRRKCSRIFRDTVVAHGKEVADLKEKIKKLEEKNATCEAI